MSLLRCASAPWRAWQVELGLCRTRQPVLRLRQWIDTPMPLSLADIVERGGTLVMGSAAAVTLGSHSLPVYEIYKVGEESRWLTGLDLLGALTGSKPR